MTEKTEEMEKKTAAFIKEKTGGTASTIFTYHQVKRLMEDYSQQESIGFAEWVVKNYKVYFDGSGKAIYRKVFGLIDNIDHNTHSLYSLYLKDKSK